MSIFGISLFGSEHVLRAGDAILNGGLNLLCYQNVSLIGTPTLQCLEVHRNYGTLASI